MEILQILTDSGLYISGEKLFDFLLRLFANILSTFVLIRFIYYPNNSRVKYLFTFFLMGMMIFLIASILDQVSLDMGFALGLFAIFGIIRFRSPSIDLKEMTYLFLVIGVSIINALVEFNVASWLGLSVANFIVLCSALFMEYYKPKNYIIKRALVFTPSTFSVLNNKKALLNEIHQNTGIDVLRVEIAKINKAKNEVAVWIFFRDNMKDNLPGNEEAFVEPEEEDNNWVSTSSNEY